MAAVVTGLSKYCRVWWWVLPSVPQCRSGLVASGCPGAAACLEIFVGSRKKVEILPR